MQIHNHRLTQGWRQASPNQGGPLKAPTLIVLHFTASGGAGPEGDADYFLSPNARVSAHAVVGRDGQILQTVPFDRTAWHAGRSVWRGVPNCNDFSLGIEIDNWGRLLRSADGQVRSWSGDPVDPARAVELTHKHERHAALWEIYPERQLAALTTLVAALLKEYPSLQEIVGHDDVAPGRKADPGPAFPMDRLRDVVQGRTPTAPHIHRKVVAHRLHARGGPGLEFAILGAFAQGQKLQVLYDSPGPWAQVTGSTVEGETVTAWVADQYLR
jgi:N-acetylmuramoyl-L-alanine amidase